MVDICKKKEGEIDVFVASFSRPPPGASVSGTEVWKKQLYGHGLTTPKADLKDCPSIFLFYFLGLATFATFTARFKLKTKKKT